MSQILTYYKLLELQIASFCLWHPPPKTFLILMQLNLRIVFFIVYSFCVFKTCLPKPGKNYSIFSYKSFYGFLVHFHVLHQWWILFKMWEVKTRILCFFLSITNYSIILIDGSIHEQRICNALYWVCMHDSLFPDQFVPSVLMMNLFIFELIVLIDCRIYLIFP